jgi:hypothetical protein
MIQRVILIAAMVLLTGVELQAARRSARGGCPNGQCSQPGYYQANYQHVDAKVATTAQPAPQAVVQATATEPIVAAQPAVNTVASEVATQPARRGLFRRWSR